MDMVQKYRSRASKSFFYAQVGACLFLSFGTYATAQTTSSEPVSPLTAAGLNPTDQPLKKGLTVLPGVRTSLTYSDNLDLAVDGTRKSGLRYELAPYVFINADTAEAQGFVYYTLRNFYRTVSPTGSGFDDPRHDFRSSGRIRVVDNFLYLRGSAFAYNINPINLSSSSFDPATVRTFNNRYQGFTIAPYVQSTLGNFASYNAGYSHGRTLVTGTGFDSTARDDRFTGDIRSGADFNRWGWEWNGLRQSRSFENGSAFGRNTSTGLLYFVPNESFRIGASMRYSQIDGFTNSAGKSQGYGPGVAIDWALSERTKLKVSANREYFGTTGELTLTYSTPRLSFYAYYDRSLIATSEGTFLNQNPSTASALTTVDGGYSSLFRNYVSQSLFLRYGVLAGLGAVESAYVQRNGGRLSMTYKLSPLSKFDLSLQRSNNYTDTRTSNPSLGGFSVVSLSLPLAGQFVGTFVSTGGTAGLELGLDARSKLKVAYDFYDNNYTTVLRRIALRSLSTTYTTKVSPDTTATLGFRHTEQSGVGFQTFNYGENAVFGAIDIRF
jgi:uncharacterized protein (PEP-CTERM system associated)